MSPFLRNVERRTMAEHEERLTTIVLAEARAESERIRQRTKVARLEVTEAKPQQQRTEKQCKGCGSSARRSRGGVCAACIAAARAELVAFVASRAYGVTAAQVADRFELSNETALKRLSRATQAGVLRRMSVGLYALGEVKP